MNQGHMKTAFHFRILSPAIAGITAIFCLTHARAEEAKAQSLEPPAATLISRSANERVWQTASGGTFHELADGLCYTNDQGAWLDSQDVIELAPGPDGGAFARQG